MSNSPVWLFDESNQVGVDYSDRDLAEGYDRQHEGFRDFQEEALKICETLGLSGDSIVLDIGCGTGGLSVHLAHKFKYVYAVDISEAMINILRSKISQQGIKNITPVQSGFLTYEHQGTDLDAIVSNIALHHLPDFWKQIALCRLHDILKPGGKLFLVDVVFGFLPREYRTSFEEWLNSMRSLAGPEMAEEAIVHVREEYSTWDWIMEGMLERAGFCINSKTDIKQNMSAYLCTK
ncbi:MAG: class I SAM-dependent methyltransferase [Pseudomonadota bacterium]